MSYTKLHLTEINEFLVKEILKHRNPVEIKVKDVDVDGFIYIEADKTEKSFNGMVLDFDLQACECAGLNELDDISDYVGKTIHTSSAYEFLEFLIDRCESANILINIENSCWVIRLINFS